MKNLELQLNDLGKEFGIKLKASISKELIEKKAKETNTSTEQACLEMVTMDLSDYFQLTEPSGMEIDFPPDWILQMYSIHYDRIADSHYIIYPDRDKVRTELSKRLQEKMKPCSILTQKILREYQVKSRFNRKQTEDYLMGCVRKACMDFNTQLAGHDMDLSRFVIKATEILRKLF